MGLELNRHAKNRLRWMGISVDEIELILRDKAPHDLDDAGNPRYLVNYEGVQILVVVALDRPDYVITTVQVESAMKADYDSEADAISITLFEGEYWDDTVEVDDTYCHVAFSSGKAANIEFLYPAKALDFVREAAEVAGVDPQFVEAAARATLAVPDLEVSIEFSDGQYGSKPVVG